MISSPHGESLDPLVGSGSSNSRSRGQLHLLYKKNKPPYSAERFHEDCIHQPTRLTVRKMQDSSGAVSSHIYAVRTMSEQKPRDSHTTTRYNNTEEEEQQEQEDQEMYPSLGLNPAELFAPASMTPKPSRPGTFAVFCTEVT